jgi:hypothetical protein
MSKYIFLCFYSLAISLFIIGQENDPINEFTIQLDNQTEIKIGDSVFNLSIDYSEYDIKEKTNKIIFTDSFIFKINEADGKIWQIQLFDNNFTLRNGISVGDNVSSIYSMYSDSKKFSIGCYYFDPDYSIILVNLRKDYRENLEDDALNVFGGIDFSLTDENVIGHITLGLPDP